MEKSEILSPDKIRSGQELIYFAETEILTRQVSGTPGKMIIYQ